MGFSRTSSLVDQERPRSAAGNGVLGAPGTRVLLDDLNFADDFRQGGRFTLGYDFESAPIVGIEASYFFLPDGGTEASFFV